VEKQKFFPKGPKEIDLVVDDSKDSKKAIDLLKKNGIKTRIIVGKNRPPNEPPYPWLISSSNGAYTGLDGVKHYIEVFGGTILVY